MDPEEIKKEIESGYVEHHGKDGQPMFAYNYKGHSILYLEISVLALSKLHTVKIRPDDILLCSHPGAGSHWMFEIGNMILKGSSERVPILKEDLLLDWAPVEHLAGAESPRLLCTHFSTDIIPPELLKDHKIIYVNRNPKASLVSYYRHLQGAKVAKYNGDFASYFELFIKGVVPYDDYFKYTQEIYALTKDNPNGFIITYEEMKQDLVKAVLHVAKFLEKPVTNDLAERIADMCTFDKMTSQKPVFGSYLPKDIIKRDATFYHNGKVDTWKKWLTVEQSEIVDAKIQSELIDQEIKFNF